MRFGRFAVHNGADFRESDVGGRSKPRPYGGEIQPPQRKSTEPLKVKDAGELPALRFAALGFWADAIVFEGY
jgi:hypothetical protein